jgi:signal transduction histidine kinase
VIEQNSGCWLPAAQRVVPVRPHVFTLTLEPGAEAVVYLSFRSEGALWLPLALWAPEHFWTYYARVEMRSFLFFGYMLALAGVAVFIAIAVRDPGYFFYPLAALTFTGFMFCYLQYPGYFRLPGFAFWNTFGIILFSVVSGPAFLLYTRQFLGLPKRSPTLDRFLIAVVLAGWSVLILFPFAPLPVLAKTGNVQAQLCLVLGFAVNIVLLFRGHRLAWLYLLAWSVFLLALLSRTLVHFGLLSSGWVSDASLQISYAFGYTLFLVALNNRLRALQADALASQQALTRELERKLKVESELHRQRETLLRDVHDGVGGIMANLRMMSGAVCTEREIESMRRLAGRMDALAAEGVMEVRSLMSALDVKTPDWTVVEAEFRRYGHLVLDPHGLSLEVVTRLDPGLPCLSNSEFIGLYRIYKEALANVLKHAQARTVVVALTTESENAVSETPVARWMRLEISDDGIGLSAESGPGRGMKSMEARIREMGGSLKVCSGPTGLTLMFRVPLQGSREAMA